LCLFITGAKSLFACPEPRPLWKMECDLFAAGMPFDGLGAAVTDSPWLWHRGRPGDRPLLITHCHIGAGGVTDHSDVLSTHANA
jgi:hypothetical protein